MRFQDFWRFFFYISVTKFSDCSCIAAVAALAHFKRPDVTTTGDGEFIIHTPAEKDLIPIVLHHYPICVSYALFEDGKIPVADPTLLEERVSEATLVLAVNAYKELCCMHLTGVSLTSPRLIQKCSEIAAERAKRVVEFIKSMLVADDEERNPPKKDEKKCEKDEKQNPKVDEEKNPEKDEKTCKKDVEEAEEEKKPRKGIIQRLKENINLNFQDVQTVDSSEMEEMEAGESSDDEPVVAGPPTLLDSKTVASVNLEDSETSGDDSDVEMQPEPSKTKPEKPQKRQEKIKEGDESEEDETIVL